MSCSTPAVLVSPPNPMLVSVVEALFKFPPLFQQATKKARGMIIQRAEAIGLDWDGTLKQLQQQDWQARLQDAADPLVDSYPSYYTQPFHAYKQGNLCWEAAQEFMLSSQSVHAPVMDPRTRRWTHYHMLRSSYGKCMLQLMAEARGAPQPSSVRTVLDVGCAAGLSSLALCELFPAAHVTGVDLSPHMVAVARYHQEQRELASGSKEPLSILHRKAEDTRLPAGSFDVVSMCLVAHELPQHATKAILQEAHRLLRPGGVMCIMEMNPSSPAFQRIFGNVFAYTAFKSTEPWLMDYVTLDLHGAMREAGFERPRQAENSPKHRTVVAAKPLTS
ncbi:S-adenosyl-L-methionine-dependent methyltransferase [Scenedesmus sp. NREL 46B-D3]|nr:S-adenosyl-L-methionine-dependent methyltransferase [Scenedesmus sp. NREL 46B-D3]